MNHKGKKHEEEKSKLTVQKTIIRTVSRRLWNHILDEKDGDLKETELYMWV
uniref:Uncharacterized protein n=1 Tax=Rhizophora mucronata TaxID=61149 RepID=A0A2P2LB05_RHIMU